MLGLTAAAMTRHHGAREVIVCDPDQQRLKRAGRFGATHAVAVHPDSGDALTDVVAEATDGHGVDVALELSGSTAAIEAGLQLLRIGGRYVWIGSVFPTGPVSVTPEHVVRRLLRVEGVHNYTPADLITAVDFLAETTAEFPFAELVSARFSLADADAAFQHAIASKAPRVAVVP